MRKIRANDPYENPAPGGSRCLSHLAGPGRILYAAEPLDAALDLQRLRRCAQVQRAFPSPLGAMPLPRHGRHGLAPERILWAEGAKRGAARGHAVTATGLGRLAVKRPAVKSKA